MEIQDLERRLRCPTPQEVGEDKALREWLMQIVCRPMAVTDLMRKCRVDYTVVRRALGNQCEHSDCKAPFPEWLMPDGTSVCDLHVQQ